MHHLTMHTYLLSGLTSVSDVMLAVWIFNNAHLLTNFPLWPHTCVWVYCMFHTLHTLAFWTFNNAHLLTIYYFWPYDCLWCYWMFRTLHTLAPSTAHYNSPSPPLWPTSPSIFVPVGKQNTFSVNKLCGQKDLYLLSPVPEVLPLEISFPYWHHM